MSWIGVYDNVSYIHKLFHSSHEHTKQSGLSFPVVWFVILLLLWVEKAKLFWTLLVDIRDTNFQSPWYVHVECILHDREWTVVICVNLNVLDLFIASLNAINYCQSDSVFRLLRVYITASKLYFHVPLYTLKSRSIIIMNIRTKCSPKTTLITPNYQPRAWYYFRLSILYSPNACYLKRKKFDPNYVVAFRADMGAFEVNFVPYWTVSAGRCGIHNIIVWVNKQQFLRALETIHAWIVVDWISGSHLIWSYHIQDLCRKTILTRKYWKKRKKRNKNIVLNKYFNWNTCMRNPTRGRWCSSL